MITPIDIQNKTFEMKLRGYSSKEVDDFLDALAKDYESIYQENISMKDRMMVMSSQIEQYKKMEETLQNSIILAQTTSEDIKKSAAAKAENIVREAEIKAEQILTGANSDLKNLNGSVSNIKAEISNYKTRIQGICAGILEMLEKME